MYRLVKHMLLFQSLFMVTMLKEANEGQSTAPCNAALYSRFIETRCLNEGDEGRRR
jgi:hypothetical protein